MYLLQEAAASDSDEEDDFIYNPLKLPLGWDGKPIPYWLYKLHGLNQEFQCEICGGATYWGRRAFERHFREYRHQAGMRLLGIPNTKNFYEITKVADAQKLWKNIQVSIEVPGPDTEQWTVATMAAIIRCDMLPVLFTSTAGMHTSLTQSVHAPLPDNLVTTAG